MRAFPATFLVLVLVLVPVGCGQPEPASPGAAPAGSALAPQDAESETRALAEGPSGPGELEGVEELPDIHALRALPYLGGAKIVEEIDGVDPARTDRERMYPGYTLLSISPRGLIVLIDESGRVLRRWVNEDGDSLGAFWVTGEGELLALGREPRETPAPETGMKLRKTMLRFRWTGERLWKRVLFAHHDLSVTPRGELLAVTSELRRVPEVSESAPLLDDALTRLTPGGEVIERVSLYDLTAASPELFPLQEMKPGEGFGRLLVDVLHTNAARWMSHEHLAARDPIYGPDNVLFCSRHQDRIGIVDMRERRLLWAWGEGELDGPHDAQVLPEGTILVFDNGLGRGWSRVIELDPLRREIIWEYRREDDPEAFYSASRGSAQRLPNGNTLISESDRGHVFEVTPEGDVVWRYLCPERVPDESDPDTLRRATIYRARRLERAFVDALERRYGGGAS